MIMAILIGRRSTTAASRRATENCELESRILATLQGSTRIIRVKT